MENFDFETIVDRRNTGNMKAYIAPARVREKGLQTFNAAEMDFKTAPSVIEAMKACAENGLMGFTLCDEIYLNAVCYWMETQRHTVVQPEWIVPTHGTIFSAATCIRLFTSPEERIIVQPPVYNRYKQAADRLGRETVYNSLKEDGRGGYDMDFEDLEKKMSDPRNKLLILCNPQNPVGRVWKEEELEVIARLAVKYGCMVYSDEIFADYAFSGRRVTPYFTVNGGKNNGITAVSLGKTFNFTGVNHANMIISDDGLRESFVRQRNRDHYGSLDPMTRAAVIGAYSVQGIAWKAEAEKLIWENYKRIVEAFSENLPQVRISPLQGGYVIWMDWRALGLAPEALAEKLEEADFILDEGTDYCISEPGFYRMSIAAPTRVVDEALMRLKRVFDFCAPSVRVDAVGSQGGYIQSVEETRPTGRFDR